MGHELVHHKQNCAGQFSDSDDMGQGYAQRDPHLRQMEIEANRDGSMCLRDFEDMLKEENTIYYEHLQKGDKKMSTKDWKNKEITQLLSEAWGFKFNSLEEFDEFNGSGELQAEAEEDIEEVAGVSPRKQDRRSPKLQRDRRPDSDREDNEKVDEVEELEEELDEQSKSDLPDRGAGRAVGGRRLDEEEEELEEGEIPAGLKKYMDSKKSKKPAGEEKDEEEDKKTSGDSKKMPMQDEPEGKDLNKDGKKGHGKVPAFLKEDDLEEAKPSREPEYEPKAKRVSKETPPEDLQEAIANLLRKHLRG